MKYICNGCGEKFDDPIESEAFWNGELQLKLKRCPYCDSDSIYDTSESECCDDDWSYGDIDEDIDDDSLEDDLGDDDEYS